MRLGVHVSIAGGLALAAERAKQRGCETFQIFIGSPRNWLSPDFSSEDINEFKEKRNQYRLEPLIAHTPYLINLASPNRKLWKKSVQKLIETVECCKKIESDYLVTHLGSHGGRGEKWGLKRVAQAVVQAMPASSDSLTLLLENSAGSGYSVGYSFEQLAEILAFTDNPRRVGICLDTCHAFAAGYDFSSYEGLSMVLLAIEEKLGFNCLKLIHANDSQTALGSRIDRHQAIGKGLIGLEGFKNLVNSPQFKHLPCILETPGMELEEDIRNLNVLKSLLEKE